MLPPAALRAASPQKGISPLARWEHEPLVRPQTLVESPSRGNPRGSSPLCRGSRDQEVPGVSLPTFSTRESRPGRGAERPHRWAQGLCLCRIPPGCRAERLQVGAGTPVPQKPRKGGTKRKTPPSLEAPFFCGKQVISSCQIHVPANATMVCQQF